MKFPYGGVFFLFDQVFQFVDQGQTFFQIGFLLDGHLGGELLPFFAVFAPQGIETFAQRVVRSRSVLRCGRRSRILRGVPAGRRRLGVLRFFVFGCGGGQRLERFAQAADLAADVLYRLFAQQPGEFFEQFFGREAAVVLGRLFDRSVFPVVGTGRFGLPGIGGLFGIRLYGGLCGFGGAFGIGRGFPVFFYGCSVFGAARVLSVCLCGKQVVDFVIL